jgi:hypothetical protein
MNGGGKVFGTINTGGVGTAITSFNLTGNNTFTNFNCSMKNLQLAAGQFQTITTSFSYSGIAPSSGNKWFSSLPGTQAYYIDTNTTTGISYYVGATSVDMKNNNRLLFSNAPGYTNLTNPIRSVTVKDIAYNASYQSFVSELITGTDTSVAASQFLSSIQENSNATDALFNAAQFLSSIQENSNAIDVLFSTVKFASNIQENAKITDASLVSVAFLSSIQEDGIAADSYSAILKRIWTVIDDDQTPNWNGVSNVQTVTWSSVDDTQPTSWQNVSTTQTPTWTDVDDEQTPGWNPV